MTSNGKVAIDTDDPRYVDPAVWVTAFTLVVGALAVVFDVCGSWRFSCSCWARYCAPSRGTPPA
jgi:hypothetical protein